MISGLMGHSIYRKIAAAAAVVISMLPCALAQTKNVEVQAFRGGYGLDFFETAAKEFNAAHPDIKVSVDGNPRVWDVLVPRFAAGTPPDLAWPGWGMNLRPIIMEGQVLPWDKYLDQPAYGNPGKTWRETFKPDLLKAGVFNGKTYTLPFNIDCYGWWYDETLFNKHGWKPPQTYEEFLVLGKKIQAQNIAPLTFTGRYPIYLLNGVYYPWVISDGGIDVYKKMINLEPGAWKHPSFLKAARCVMDLKKERYFQGGCIGMNHTESQMELLVHRAAMIPCGSWIQAEMSNLVPENFKMTFLKTPSFKDGAGDPTALFVGADGKGWTLPVKGKNPDAAAEYYRYVSSPEKAALFIEQKGTMTAIITEREPKLPPHLVKPFEAVKNARVTWLNNVGDWYTPLETEIETAVVDMYNEVITPQEFVERCEVKAQEFRKSLGKDRLQWD